MEFVVYGRVRPDVADAADELTEKHWAYLDRFSDRLIARGPTFSDDESEWTGSLHIVDLEDAEAARGFAEEEPYFLDGVFERVEIHRWRNDSGRTMWDFARDPGKQRFLVFSARPGAIDVNDEHVILAGPLLSDDGRHERGAVWLVEHDDRQAVERHLGEHEVHRWDYGGRR
jgi:uncharacterized protein YciI